MNKPPQRTVARSALRDALCDIATTAGEVIRQVYRADFKTWEKPDETPLTEADLKANDVILQSLRSLTPDTPVLSEESTDIAYEDRRQWQCYWLIDPLDGTRSFIEKTDEFSTNIAYIEYGRPTLGVIVNPISGELYLGDTTTRKAWKKNKGNPERIAISTRDIPTHRIKILCSRHHYTDDERSFIERVGRCFDKVETTHKSSSLKFCAISEGLADICVRFGPTSEWDIAAGHAILSAAGGSLRGLDGREIRYNGKESLINPSFIAIGSTHGNAFETLVSLFGTT